ncbi:MAG: hypothetical protein ACXWAT_02040 [Methylobacter sp.]
MSDYDRRIIPPFVNVGKHQRMVDPSVFTEDQKQALWVGIKIDNPALADALKNDANIAALKNAFNATVRFPADEFNGYLQTGLKAGKEKI